VSDIDQIIALVKSELPDVRCTRLTVPDPADEEGLWFFRLSSAGSNVLIESPSGTCPFVIEDDTSAERFCGETVAEVVARVVELVRH
jgi:hypothetical protein